MLEGLDQVDWAHLWACGPATDVPQQIRTLASSTDRPEREEALAHLSSTVIYQTMSILEVTPYAVPFLIELLSIETLEEQFDLLMLLTLIARGAPFIIGAGAFLEFPDEAVEQGVPIYLTFLAHPAAACRMLAAFLLSLFPDQASVTIPSLHARLAD